MVQTLQKNKRFQEEVAAHKATLEKIPAGPKKDEFKKTLDILIFEVKKLDNMYLDMVYSNQLTSFGAEMRDHIVSIRKKLDNLSKEFK